MDYIGGMLNHIGKMPKNTLQKGILYYLKKLMVHNGILMETIWISVMPIGLVWFKLK